MDKGEHSATIQWVEDLATESLLHHLSSNNIILNVPHSRPLWAVFSV